MMNQPSRAVGLRQISCSGNSKSSSENHVVKAKLSNFLPCCRIAPPIIDVWFMSRESPVDH